MSIKLRKDSDSQSEDIISNMNFSSEMPATATLAEIDDDGTVIEINTYLYIPFVLFIFGAPLLFIAFLCYLQHRSKQLHRREWERLNNRRLSTQSGIYTGRGRAAAAATNARINREERL